MGNFYLKWGESQAWGGGGGGGGVGFFGGGGGGGGVLQGGGGGDGKFLKSLYIVVSL